LSKSKHYRTSVSSSVGTGMAEWPHGHVAQAPPQLMRSLESLGPACGLSTLLAV